MKHGKGKLLFAKGGSYEGTFSKDQYHGSNCTYIWPDGSQFTGTYEAGMRNGQGTLTKPDGRCYKGTWSENRRHGQILFTDAKGKQYRQEWKDDKRVKSELI